MPENIPIEKNSQSNNQKLSNFSDEQKETSQAVLQEMFQKDEESKIDNKIDNEKQDMDLEPNQPEPQPGMSTEQQLNEGNMQPEGGEEGLLGNNQSQPEAESKERMDLLKKAYKSALGKDIDIQQVNGEWVGIIEGRPYPLSSLNNYINEMQKLRQNNGVVTGGVNKTKRQPNTNGKSTTRRLMTSTPSIWSGDPAQISGSTDSCPQSRNPSRT
jgi:hypothetical protein